MIMTIQFLENPMRDRHQTWYTFQLLLIQKLMNHIDFWRSQGQRTVYSGHKKTSSKQYLEKPLLVGTL